jgi:APA family basic amino acid/polyamine antiporter
VAVGLGAILGAGLFVVTGVAAGIAGAAFVLGLLLAGAAAACNALSSAQLAAAYPQAGGAYEYGYRLLSPAAGFAAGWLFLIAKLAAGGTVALGFGGYLEQLLPGVPARPAAVAAVALLTVANLYGIRKAGRLNTAIVTLTVAVLIAFVLAGLPAFTPGNLRPFAPRGWSGVLEAAALLFFAYTGYARVATLGEEVRDPRTTIPRAILLALGGSLLLYTAVSVVAVGAVGAPALAATRAPLERAAAAMGVPGLPAVVTLGAATAMLGVLLSQILGISRMLFALARRGDLPRGLARVHPAHSVPDRAVWLTGAVILGLTVFGNLEWVLGAAAFTILLYYAIANLAALRQPAAERLAPPWVSVVGLGLCLLLAAALPPRVIGAGTTLLLAGFAFRWILHRLSPPARP